MAASSGAASFIESLRIAFISSWPAGSNQSRSFSMASMRARRSALMRSAS